MTKKHGAKPKNKKIKGLYEVRPAQASLISELGLGEIVGHLTEPSSYSIRLAKIEDPMSAYVESEKNIETEPKDNENLETLSEDQVENSENKDPLPETIETESLEKLVSAEEIQNYLEGNEYQEALKESDYSAQQKLAYWLYQQRLAKGFSLDEIENKYGSWSDTSASEYAKWDWEQASKIATANIINSPEFQEVEDIANNEEKDSTSEKRLSDLAKEINISETDSTLETVDKNYRQEQVAEAAKNILSEYAGTKGITVSELKQKLKESNAVNNLETREVTQAIFDLARQENLTTRSALDGKDYYSVDGRYFSVVELTPEEQASMKANEAKRQQQIDQTYATSSLSESPKDSIETEVSPEISGLAIQSESIASPKHPDRNEDSILTDSKQGIIGLFDGMGGYEGGQEASKFMSKEVAENLKQINWDANVNRRREQLEKALLAANQKFKSEIQEKAGLSKAGTTADVVKIFESQNGLKEVIGAHIGDGRVFVIDSDGALHQITLDHDACLIDLGPDDAAKMQHRLSEISDVAELDKDQELKDFFYKRNQIASFIGKDNQPMVSTYAIQLSPGQQLLLSTDGLHDNLTVSEMEKVVKDSLKDNLNISQELSKAALSRSQDGSIRSKSDDISVMVVNPYSAESEPNQVHEKPKDVMESYVENLNKEDSKLETESKSTLSDKEIGKAIEEYLKQSGEIPSEKKAEVSPSPEKEINPEADAWVLGRLKQEFSLEAESLPEGFNNLSSGEKVHLLENLRNQTLSRVEEEATEKIESKNRSVGFVRRSWRGIWNRYYTSKEQKAAAGDVKSEAGQAKSQELITDLIKSVPEVGVPVGAVKRGENFTSEFKFSELLPESKTLTSQTKEIFNDAANGLSRIPYEHSLLPAKNPNRKKYEEAKRAYQVAKEQLLTEISADNHNEDGSLTPEEAKAFEQLNRVESVSKLTQFLTMHPDAAGQLENMRSRGVLGSIVGGASEKIAYGAAGYGARHYAAMSLLGLGVIPAAALSGAAFAFFRAVSGNKKATKEGRYGSSAKAVNEEGKLNKNVDQRTLGYTSIEKLNNRFERLNLEVSALKEKINELQTIIDTNELNEYSADSLAGAELEIKKCHERLERKSALLRLTADFAEAKLNAGLVDFGRTSNRLSKQYDLIQGLSQARTNLSGLNRQEELQSRLEKIMASTGEDLTGARGKARRKFIAKQMVMGAAIGGTAAAAGYALRDGVAYLKGDNSWISRGVDSLRDNQSPAPTAPVGSSGGVSASPEFDPDSVKPNVIHGVESSRPEVPTQPSRPPLNTNPNSFYYNTPFPDHEPTPNPESVPTNLPSGPGGGAPIENISAPEANQSLPEILKPYVNIEYQGGRSIWKEAELQLTKRFERLFTELGGANSQAAEALKTYNIDILKDEIVNHPERYGLEAGFDPRRLTKEVIANLNWNEAFANAFPNLEDNLVKALSPEQMNSVLENNAALREALHHPVPTPPANLPVTETVEEAPSSEIASSSVPEKAPVSVTGQTGNMPEALTAEDIFGPESSRVSSLIEHYGLDATEANRALSAAGITDAHQAELVIGAAGEAKLPVERALSHRSFALLENITPEDRGALIRLLDNLEVDKEALTHFKNYEGFNLHTAEKFVDPKEGEKLKLYFSHRPDGGNHEVTISPQNFEINGLGWDIRYLRDFINHPGKYLNRGSWKGTTIASQ